MESNRDEDGFSQLHKRMFKKAASVKEESGELWAVLVSAGGPHDWYDYSTESEVCRAYHILRNNSVPEENIIVMMNDIMANHTNNINPGKLYYSPNGEDVYAGCKIDYSHEDVTPHNFVAILLGDKTAAKGGNGRVLDSTDKDNVFVYSIGHGSDGILHYPYNKILHADTLNSTLSSMHSNNTYKEMTIYLEACHSGSMFEGILQKELNIYAVTAANPDQNSKMTYCYESTLAPGTCIGAVFSNNWMDDVIIENTEVVTLEKQFEIVKAKSYTKTNSTQNAQQYGDLEITSEVVANFLGTNNGTTNNLLGKSDKKCITSIRHIRGLTFNLQCWRISSRMCKI